MAPIVIIGSGLAGYTLAREFRKLDKETPLVIVTADDGRFYSKPMLSNALASGKSPDALATHDAAQMQTQLNAEIHTYATVDAINTEQHTVSVKGETIQYSKLVLALGAGVIRPPLQGNAANEILTVNDLADYARFRDAISGVRRIAIIGGGLIGCEFANDLRIGGYEVEVIHPGSHPLDSMLPAEAGEAVRQALEAQGVVWQLNKKAEGVGRIGQDLHISLSDGSEVVADVVLSAIGLRPNIALAQSAGMQVNRGIVVNRMLESSAPDVYALGDCAEVDGKVLLYVMPLMNAARALAKTLSGSPTEVAYPAMPVAVKTPACPVAVCPAPAGSDGKWQVTCDENGVSALFYGAENKLLGFALTGKTTAQKNALAQQLPVMLG